MTAPPQPPRTFLGRPDAAYPGFVPSSTSRARIAPQEGVRAGRLWLAQAVTGALLLVFLGIHLVAQHLLVPGGLRDYESVISYLRNPVTLAAEIGLLGSVVTHVVLGVRSSFVGVVGPVGLRRVTAVLGIAGAMAFAYAVWLTLVLVVGGTPA